MSIAGVRITPEFIIAVLLAVIAGTGAFYTLQARVDAGGDTMRRLEGYILRLEDRQAEHGQRLDAHALRIGRMEDMETRLGPVLLRIETSVSDTARRVRSLERWVTAEQAVRRGAAEYDGEPGLP